MSDVPPGPPDAPEPASEPPPPGAAPPSWFAQLGPRSVRRPEPRLAVSLAASGCALAVIGVLFISGDTLVGAVGDTNQVPGIILSLLVMVAGYALLAQFADGPLSTAGVVASALAAPPLLFFLTFDEGGFPPFSAEAILGLSALIWLASYAAGPGKGHSFYLGAGLIAAWLFVLELVEGILTFPFDFFGAFAFGLEPGFDDSLGPSDPFADEFSSGGFGPDPFSNGFTAPSPETLGILSLLFAVAYVLAARALDRSDRVGMATPFALAALIIAPIALLFLSDTLGQFLTGVAFVALGLVFGASGATTGRRFTTWIGGAFVAQGMVVIAAEVLGDDATATSIGLILIVFGLLIVAAGWAVVEVFGEQLETEAGPSVLRLPPSSPPAPPPPAASPPPSPPAAPAAPPGAPPPPTP